MGGGEFFGTSGDNTVTHKPTDSSGTDNSTGATSLGSLSLDYSQPQNSQYLFLLGLI